MARFPWRTKSSISNNKAEERPSSEQGFPSSCTWAMLKAERT
jgi:hypothetical protein